MGATNNFADARHNDQQTTKRLQSSRGARTDKEIRIKRTEWLGNRPRGRRATQRVLRQPRDQVPKSYFNSRFERAFNHYNGDDHVSLAGTMLQLEALNRLPDAVKTETPLEEGELTEALEEGDLTDIFEEGELEEGEITETPSRGSSAPFQADSEIADSVYYGDRSLSPEERLGTDDTESVSFSIAGQSTFNDSRYSSPPCPPGLDPELLRKHRALDNSSAFYDFVCGRPVRATLRPTDKVHDRRLLTPGTIISAPYHSQAHQDTIRITETNVALTSFGTVHSKFRKMIVLEAWGEHLACLPLYSYMGRGLAKRRGMLNEYISVRDEADPRPEPKDTPDEPLSAIRDPGWHKSKTFIKGKTICKLSEKIVHNLDQKCSIEGRVVRADFTRLYMIYVDIVREKMFATIGK
ncbi:hypothetical protein G7046_g7328 [Stylonectria norvegica]|nr:hypothetical protein G7046_g7328 [Stylonectria norvegica]